MRIDSIPTVQPTRQPEPAPPRTEEVEERRDVDEQVRRPDAPPVRQEEETRPADEEDRTEDEDTSRVDVRA